MDGRARGVEGRLHRFKTLVPDMSPSRRFDAGMDPSTWEGAAYQMGNTPTTWQQHYNPLHRMRAMQAAVDSNAEFSGRMREAQPEGALAAAPILLIRETKRRREEEEEDMSDD